MEGKFHAFLPANASSCEKNEQRKIFRYLDDDGGGSNVAWVFSHWKKFHRFAVEIVLKFKYLCKNTFCF
jgi:hypothetical protein